MFLFSLKTSNTAINIKEIEIENIQNGYSAGNTLRLRSWNTTLADEHKLRVFENKVLRKIYGTR